MSLRGPCIAFPPLGSRCKLEISPVNPPLHPIQHWGYLGCTARGSLGMRMGLVSARCRLRLATSRLRRRRRAARGGAGCAAGHRRPQALPAGWRRGGRGRWRVPYYCFMEIDLGTYLTPPCFPYHCYFPLITCN